MLLLTNDVQCTKKQAFRQHVVNNQKLYVVILRQNTVPLQPQDKTFTIFAEQLVKFAANSSQSQVCYINSPRAQLTKSQVCVAEFQRLPKLIILSTTFLAF